MTDSANYLIIVFSIFKKNVILLRSISTISSIPNRDARPNVMKAVVLQKQGKPEVLRVEWAPLPDVLPHQILVRVKAAGINPIDGHLRSGRSYQQLQLPMILGKEISGTVEECGALVKQFKPDDRVFCGIENGGYAEFAAANESDCYMLPSRLTFIEGACLYVTYFTAYRGLVLWGNLDSSSSVLIHGASGSLGIAAIQIAKYTGAKVVASVKGYDLEEMMLNAGADAVVYHELNSDNYLYDALNAVKKTGFNVILEILGNVDIERSKKFSAPYGRIIVLGNRVLVDPINVKPKSSGEPIVYTVKFFKYTSKQQQMAADFVIDAVQSGFITPVVGYKYQLKEAAKAHFDIVFSQSCRGKSVFVI